MRTILVLALIFVSAASLFFLFWGRYDFEILGYKDFELQKNQNRPALTSSLREKPYWESFNEWRCYPTYSVQIHCYTLEGKTPEDFSPEKRNGKLYFSTMTLWYKNQSLLFESAYYLNDLSTCLEEGEEWRRLIKNQKTVCLFAAQLPEPRGKKHADISNWTLYGMKTFSGRIMAPIYEDEKE